MTIAVGDKIPDVEVWTMGPEGPQTLRTAEALGSGKAVLFGVPGAFTPGCSKVHLPGFVAGADQLTSRGVERIACVAVNDAWVMDVWGREHEVGDRVLMLADGAAEFTRAMGLDADMSGFGLGVRSRRYAAVLEDGVVSRLDVEEKPGVDVSACEAVLTRL